MGRLGGLIGLNTDLNKRSQGIEDRNTMMRMLQLKEKDEKEEMMAEAQYAEQMAKVSAQADLLLENDRNAINKKAAGYRKEITDSLKSHGGSYSAWMKGGGISQIRDYQKRVLEGDEFTRYKDNKISMERIIAAKDAGKGHLISEKDLKNATAYNKNKGGTITYSGLNSEVAIDPMAFEFGHEVTPEEVLASANNRMAIIHNFENDTGETYNRTLNDDLLKQYVVYKGYGGVGKNYILAQQRLAKQAAAAKAKAKSENFSVSATVSKAANSVGRVGFDQMNFKDNEKGFGAGENASILGAEEHKASSWTPEGLASKIFSGLSFSDKGFKEVYGSHIDRGKEYRLKGAAKVLQGHGGRIIQGHYGEQIKPDEKGTFALDPRDLEGTYMADGTKLTGRSSMRGWKNNYKPMETLMVYKGKDGKNQEDILIVDPYKNGKLDKEGLADMYGGGKPEGNGTMVVRMHDPENPGFDFYQEVPVNSVASQKMLSTIMADQDNITAQIEEQRQQQTRTTQSERKGLNQAQIIRKNALEQSEKIQKEASKFTVFESPSFDFVKQHYKTETGGNRNDLVQSFYTTAGQGDEETTKNAIEGKDLRRYLEGFGLYESMFDDSVSDKKIMEDFYKKDGDGSPEDRAESYYYWEMWNDSYQNLIKNKK